MMVDKPNKEILKAITFLEATDMYKVTRKLLTPPWDPPWDFLPPEGLVKTGLVLDTETTGWDPVLEKVINYAHVLFTFSPITGAIFSVKAIYNGFEDPCMPLDPNITIVTGITDDMVKDQHFDDAVVLEHLAQADLVIAHNAGFDRKFVERRFPEFVDKLWACSINGVDWGHEHVSSKTLSFIAYVYGFYFDAHMALNDCLATLEILRQDTPRTKSNIMLQLVKSARQKQAQIWAVNAPYELKDTLRMQRYKWSSGEDGRTKAWFKTVMAGEEEQAEMKWLSENVYGKHNMAKITYITAKDRFSIRE